MSKLNRNIPILDSLRAFAALSVCAFHFICTVKGFIHNEILLGVFSFGKFGVHTFFVISGFIIPWSMYNNQYTLKKFGVFLLKRLIRLEPPYIASLLLTVTILLVRNHIYSSQNSAKYEFDYSQLLAHLGYLVPFTKDIEWLNVVYWTLAIEFQYYILIGLLFFMLIHKNIFIRACFYTLVFIASFYKDVNFLPNWLPVFSFGILLFQFKMAIINKFEFLFYTVFFIIFSLFEFPIALLVFALIPVLTIHFFNNYKIKFLDQIGKFSYSLYLVHTLIGTTLLNILSHMINLSILKFLAILSAFIISGIAAYLLFLFIEKPSKRLSKSLKFT